MNWTRYATALADTLTDRRSRWQTPLATTPRHLFVPRWWENGPSGWELRNGKADAQEWYAAAYRDTSLVTRVGPLHADFAVEGDRPRGRPTSSATLPSLVVRMFRHAWIDDADNLLDVGTGSGYGAALAARRLSDEQVTSVDVDPYLIDAARQRCAQAGTHPTLEPLDATGDLPVDFDKRFERLVATVAVRPVPPDWLAALCRGGRLVTTLAGTSLIITAEKDEDGGATGRVAWDRAGFMHARHSADYPPGLDEILHKAREQDGEDVTHGPYPVLDVANAWDLDSMLSLTSPGIEHEYHRAEDGPHTAVMAHADGSWARAIGYPGERPTVHQSGPRRLWDDLDQCRNHWLNHGELPLRGAHVFIKPDGTTILARGDWHVKLTREPAND